DVRTGRQTRYCPAGRARGRGAGPAKSEDTAMRPFARSRRLRCSAAALGAVAILGACSSGETPGAAASAARPSQAAQRKSLPSNVLSPDMVSAVSAGGTGAPAVQVKFELRQRPGVAQPVDIDLAIVPASGALDRVSGKVEVGDGLELGAGGQLPPLHRPLGLRERTGRGFTGKSPTPSYDGPRVLSLALCQTPRTCGRSPIRRRQLLARPPRSCGLTRAPQPRATRTCIRSCAHSCGSSSCATAPPLPTSGCCCAW